MVDTRFQDGRMQRRNLTGIATGLASGALVGLALGWLLPRTGSLVSAAVGIVIGAAAGALLGMLLIRRVSPDDWEPLTSHRSYVGAHAPDADARDITAVGSP
jgi:uncharacterized membrane protein